MAAVQVKLSMALTDVDKWRERAGKYKCEVDNLQRDLQQTNDRWQKTAVIQVEQAELVKTQQKVTANLQASVQLCALRMRPCSFSTGRSWRGGSRPCSFSTGRSWRGGLRPYSFRTGRSWRGGSRPCSCSTSGRARIGRLNRLTLRASTEGHLIAAAASAKRDLAATCFEGRRLVATVQEDRCQMSQEERRRRRTLRTEHSSCYRRSPRVSPEG